MIDNIDSNLLGCDSQGNCLLMDDLLKSVAAGNNLNNVKTDAQNVDYWNAVVNTDAIRTVS